MSKLFRKILIVVMVFALLLSLAGCGAAKYNTPKISDVGAYIEFGTWHEKPIKWRVLAVEDGKALIISKYALAIRQYDGLENFSGKRLSNGNADYDAVNITWADSEIRTWLNEDFFDKAFSSSEKQDILTSTVSNSGNPSYGTPGGIDTEDKVFLLSIDEATLYFTDDDDRITRGVGTEEDLDYLLNVYEESYGYAADDLDELRAWSEYWIDDDWACRWWLRSPGSDNSRAAFVGIDGGIGESGLHVNYENSAKIAFHLYLNLDVRPALWIQID